MFCIGAELSVTAFPPGTNCFASRTCDTFIVAMATINKTADGHNIYWYHFVRPRSDDRFFTSSVYLIISKTPNKVLGFGQNVLFKLPPAIVATRSRSQHSRKAKDHLGSVHASNPDKLQFDTVIWNSDSQSKTTFKTTKRFGNFTENSLQWDFHEFTSSSKLMYKAPTYDYSVDLLNDKNYVHMIAGFRYGDNNSFTDHQLPNPIQLFKKFGTGTPLETTTTPLSTTTTMTANSTVEDPNPTTPKPSNVVTITMAIACAFLAIILIAVGIAGYKSRNKSSRAAELRTKPVVNAMSPGTKPVVNAASPKAKVKLESRL